MVSLAVLVERLRHVARGLGPPRFGQPSPVYNLHHLGNRNIGDRQCVPLHDFRHLATNRMRVVDMSLTDPLVASVAAADRVFPIPDEVSAPVAAAARRRYAAPMAR